MDKVQVTKEQAEAIQDISKSTSGLQFFVDCKKHFQNKYKSLKELNVDEVARVMYTNDYEIIPEIKVGDWVTNEIGDVGKIVFEGYVSETYGLDNGKDTIARPARHATEEEIEQEKERRWWAKHGRDVWELKKGDVIHALKYGTMRDIKVPSIITENRDKENFRVICFVEDRKDI